MWVGLLAYSGFEYVRRREGSVKNKTENGEVSNQRMPYPNYLSSCPPFSQWPCSAGRTAIIPATSPNTLATDLFRPQTLTRLRPDHHRQDRPPILVFNSLLPIFYPFRMRSKFKDEHTFEKRKAEAERIRQKYADRIPVRPPLPPHALCMPSNSSRSSAKR